MTEEQASKTLDSLIHGLGVKAGDSIYLAVDMSRLPLPRWHASLNRQDIRAREERWCAFVYDRILRFVGKEGTLIVGTFSYSCANPSIPFDYERTPSEIGPFTEWIRRHPDSIRSLHPVFSVTAIGAHAKEFVSDTGASAFGPCSPFGRFGHKITRFVNLGVSFSQSLTYIHHLEQCYGCNHRYHKVFQGQVLKSGEQVMRKFFGYMRWRGVDASVNVEPLERTLRRRGVMIEIAENRFFGQSALVSDVDRAGYSMLIEDPWAFSTNKFCIDIDHSAVPDSPLSASFTKFSPSA